MDTFNLKLIVMHFRHSFKFAHGLTPEKIAKNKWEIKIIYTLQKLPWAATKNR